MLSKDTDKVDEILESYSRTLTEIAQVAMATRSSQATARPEDYFRQAAACTLALKGSLFLPETLAASDEDGRKEIIDLAERAVELQAAGLEQLLKSPSKKSWLRRLHQREQFARQALYQANLALVYLGSFEGDPSQTLERALSQLESALASAHSHHLPAEVTVKLGASLGSVLLHYPTDALQAYARRAEEILRATTQVLQARVPVYKKLEGLRDTYGRGTSFLKFLFLGLPQGLPLILSMIWRPFWQGVPKEIFGEILTPTYPGKVYWALGIAYERFGLYEKARECLDTAVDLLPSDSNEIAGACLCRGSLSLPRQGDAIRLEDVRAAEEWFDLANDLSEDETTFPRGCAELAHVYLRAELLAGISRSDKREKFLSQVRDDLRNSLRIVRKHRMHALAQDILSSLAVAYTLLGEGERAYRAAALGCRIGDRLHTFARTPRFKTHLASGYVSNSTNAVEMIFEHLQATKALRNSSKHVLTRRALYFAEQARTRLFQELLASRELLPRGAQHSELDAFFLLRRSWLSAELALMERETADLPSLDPTELLREGRNALETQYFGELRRVRERFNDLTYDPDQPLTPVRFSEVSSAIGALSLVRETALVEYFCTDRRLLVFVVLPPKAVAMAEEPLFLDTGISVEELQDVARRWEEGRSKLLSEEISLAQWTNGYLGQVLDRLRLAVERPVKAIEQWEHEEHRSVQRVILVPHRFLHLLPLHAVPLSDGTRWSDTVSIQYVPSASVLCRLLKRNYETIAAADQPSRPSGIAEALAVAYAGEKRPLPFNHDEASAVAELTGAAVLEGKEATPARVLERMRDARYIHFTCHGVYEPAAPLQSGLDLALSYPSDPSGCELPPDAGDPDRDVAGGSVPEENQRLALGRIFEELELTQLPVVTLSACESGIPKVEELRDEYVSLPAGFLFAGARAVISSLWPVNALATWLLMKLVVKELARGAPPADALSRGQRELMCLSVDNVRDSVRCAIEKELNPAGRELIVAEAERFFADAERPYPFIGPYWWSGFIVSGLAHAPIQGFGSPALPKDASIDAAHGAATL